MRRHSLLARACVCKHCCPTIPRESFTLLQARPQRARPPTHQAGTAGSLRRRRWSWEGMGGQFGGAHVRGASTASLHVQQHVCAVSWSRRDTSTSFSSRRAKRQARSAGGPRSLRSKGRACSKGLCRSYSLVTGAAALRRGAAGAVVATRAAAAAGAAATACVGARGAGIALAITSVPAIAAA